MSPRSTTPRSGATKAAGGRHLRRGHRLAGPLLLAIAPLASAGAAHVENRTEYRAPRAGSAPVVDGIASEEVWGRARWQPIDQLWLGPDYAASDFRGRFKVVWTPDRLYLLVEIVDDILFDSHRDPLVQYWDDDCLEVFVDEDFSGGDHQYSHNAFAYHLSLDNQAIDIGTDRAAHRYTDHVGSRWQQGADGISWEVSIALYPDDYVDGSPGNRPVTLAAGKVIGLMVAWCDNEGSEIRENFVGSESVLRPEGPRLDRREPVRQAGAGRNAMKNMEEEAIAGPADQDEVTGEFVDVDGEGFYVIRNVDRMTPFLLAAGQERT